MPQIAYLYCDPRSLNDATNYYVNLIKDCLIDRGYTYAVVHKLSDMKNPDVILTITERYFLCSKLRFPKVKTIYWSQGVSAEEAKIGIHGGKSLLRYFFRRVVEPIAIKRSDILFCVSDRMVKYYKEEYGLRDKGQIIVMPCYNLQPSKLGDSQRYNSPTFVYAGNISKWQCIDEMLEVYSIVEKKLPSSKLVIYSANKEEFKKLISNYGIKNYEIKFVSVDALGEEMLNYKYGFVIRDKHIINQVATPTKLNSYLSSYLIPIFSDGVDAFIENIDLGEFTLIAKCPLCANEIANQIITFEMGKHNYSDYIDIVNEVFRHYYNDEIYEAKLKLLLQNI